MRRSFGPPMGSGGGGAGGGMIKTVHRALRAGVGGGGADGEPYSHSATTAARTTNNRNQSAGKTISLSSNNNSQAFGYLNHLAPAATAEQTSWAFSTAPAASGEEFGWEYVDGGGSDGDSVYDDFVFGGVPSKDEVDHAVSSLQEALDPIPSSQIIKNRRMYDPDNEILSPTSLYKSGSDSDWMEPSLHLCNSTSTLQIPDSNRVYDAFHLLQTEPSVKRMVISLSSDKAVWDAVMNNEVVRELREAVNVDKSISEGSEGSVDESNPVTEVLRWIFVNTKEKMIEIVEKITKIVNELVQPVSKEEKLKHEGGGATQGSFEEKIKSSFLLSVMVLLIVVMTRAHRA